MAACASAPRTLAPCMVTICGAGASGSGLLVAAIQYGFSEVAKARGGIVAFDKQKQPQSMLEHTCIPSNSFASVFLECLPALQEKYPHHDSLKEFLNSNEVVQLNALGKNCCELRIVGAYLRMLSRVVWDLASQEQFGRLYASHEVSCVSLGCKSLEVQTRNCLTGETVVQKSRFVVLAMGGFQNVAQVARVSIHGSITLAPHVRKIILSHTVVQQPKIVYSKLRQNLRENTTLHITADAPVVIVGGSHSAWSSAYNLLTKVANSQVVFEDRSIIILHRSPLRFFYLTTEEAKSEGYDFDPEMDVCPLTGRVNRYGGLRYDVCDFAKGVVLRGEETRISTVRMDSSFSETACIGLLSRSTAIVSAMGYGANIPEIRRENGAPVNLKSRNGQLIVNEAGQCYTSDGDLLPNLLATGLGAGQTLNPKVGGEQSFKGRIDGVWLYQHDMGKLLLSTMTQQLALSKNGID